MQVITFSIQQHQQTLFTRLCFAWSKSPQVYKDEYNAAGLPGSNGIPDILDEAHWGLEWLMKMNPDSGDNVQPGGR